jgi:cytochrome P450
MDTRPEPFVPPAPIPRTKPPSTLEMMRIVYRNPLELWGEPSYNEPWISVNGVGGPLVIANDPGLIRHVLVDNAKNYKMATVRQKILRPILRDGLLTAEGDVWRRSRKAMAPVFTRATSSALPSRCWPARSTSSNVTKTSLARSMSPTT